jgi:hypothetical protein
MSESILAGNAAHCAGNRRADDAGVAVYRKLQRPYVSWSCWIPSARLKRPVAPVACGPIQVPGTLAEIRIDQRVRSTRHLMKAAATIGGRDGRCGSI